MGKSAYPCFPVFPNPVMFRSSHFQVFFKTRISKNFKNKFLRCQKRLNTFFIENHLLIVLIYSRGWPEENYLFRVKATLKDVLLNMSNFEAYLGPCKISLVELLCKNSYRLKAVDYFHKNSQLWMLDRVLPEAAIQRCSVKMVPLKISQKFIGKHLCQSSF